jgi:hypothetical protein
LLRISTAAASEWSASVATTICGETSDRPGILKHGKGTNEDGVNGNQICFGGTLIATKSGGIGKNPLKIDFNGNAARAGAQAVLRAQVFTAEGREGKFLTAVTPTDRSSPYHFLTEVGQPSAS